MNRWLSESSRQSIIGDVPTVVESQRRSALTYAASFDCSSLSKQFLKHADGWRGFFQWVDLFGTKELLGTVCVEARKTLELLSRGRALAALGVEAADLLPVAASTKDTDVFVIVKPERALAGTVIWLAGTVASRVVWKKEMAHSSGWLTTNRSPWRATTGGTRRGRAYQEVERREAA